MSLIYLAGPIDYGTNDSNERQDFIASMGSDAIVYDATTTFVAPSVEYMTKRDMGGAISIHHSAIEACTLFVGDMRRRSVGIPIEMWIAYEYQKPIYTLYDHTLPRSIYIEYVTKTFAYSWDEMERLVENALDLVSV
jgi:hypothetical protein